MTIIERKYFIRLSGSLADAVRCDATTTTTVVVVVHAILQYINIICAMNMYGGYIMKCFQVFFSLFSVTQSVVVDVDVDVVVLFKPFSA